MVIENMYQAKTHLSRLVDKALEGEDVVISRAGKPLVRLVPYEELPEPLKFGLLKGRIQIADDFNELSPDIEDAFEGYLPS
jgi:prevent-host-death family protein